jgi:hypothetical protein
MSDLYTESVLDALDCASEVASRCSSLKVLGMSLDDLERLLLPTHFHGGSLHLGNFHGASFHLERLIRSKSLEEL